MSAVRQETGPDAGAVWHYGDPMREPGEGCAVADNASLIRAMLDGTHAVPQPILDQVSALAQLARA